MDIDTLSAELSREIALESVEKALPPKLLYRFRRWMRMMRATPEVKKMPMGKFEQAVYEKFEELQRSATLNKNEAMASFFDSGIVKMDFGSDVSEKAKEAALKWAKKRGLKTVEASLSKSANGTSSFVFSATSATSEDGICMKRLKWMPS